MALVIGLGGYATYQRLGWQREEVKFAQYRADVETAAAAARVKAAQEAARQALNAQEALDALQTRHAQLGARYVRLRDSAASGGGVPGLSSAAPILSTCPGKHLEPDATARFLAAVESAIAGVLEAGDGEIAKYVQLWALQQKNATAR